jgi:hypothetical protein
MQPSSVGWGKEKDNETLCGINLIIHYKGTIHENTKCEEGKEREGKGDGEDLTTYCRV